MPLPDDRVTPPQVLPYATVRSANPPANRSLIWGLTFLIPLFPGLAAIRYGRQGLRYANATATGRSKSKAGIILGSLNLIWSCYFVVMLPIAILRAREVRERVACAGELRTLAMGVMMYASGNNGYTPPTLATLTTSGSLAKAPVCPKVGAPNYIYMLPLIRLNTIRSASTTVIAYEPLSNHGTGLNAAFADGHVEYFAGGRAAALLSSVAPTPATLPAAK